MGREITNKKKKNKNLVQRERIPVEDLVMINCEVIYFYVGIYQVISIDEPFEIKIQKNSVEKRKKKMDR